MSIAKRRLSPEESRLAALTAARDLLIETGPQAVTLKAVAGRIGRTHANLLHHFGSASGLQKALAAYLAKEICQTIGAAVIKTRSGEGSAREIVDLAFDAFDREGAGALASWMMLSGNEDALDPIVEAIHQLVDDLAEHGPDGRLLHEDTLTLCIMALGDALMGAQLAGALGLPRDTARAIAARQLDGSLERWQAERAATVVEITPGS
ncbi:TetR family transcriptional regulator [Blastomonas sp.]|uniref:TetR family transcriptional regulator n=1 Tax=Blastomonas sp. TaxID=1909299 RepID=UPI003593AEA2